MSSNIRINRICQHCGETFIAKTTVTKYCGDTCAKRAYKVRKRYEKIENSKNEVPGTSNVSSTDLSEKEFLSIDEVCALVGVSRWTLWRAIKRQDLPVIKIGKRTIIKKTELANL